MTTTCPACSDSLVDTMVDAAIVDYPEPHLARLMRPALTDLAAWITRGDVADLPRRTGLSQEQVDRAVARMRTARDGKPEKAQSRGPSEDER